MQHDCRVRFITDGDNGAEFIYYDECLYTWFEFVRKMEATGLTREFIIDYVFTLPCELVNEI